MIRQVQSFFSGFGLSSVHLVTGGLYRKGGWMRSWPFNEAEAPPVDGRWSSSHGTVIDMACLAYSTKVKVVGSHLGYK